MRPYALGIDSGGTQYRVRAVALDSTVLGEYSGESCSHYDLGPQKAAERIRNHIQNCLQSFGGNPKDCCAIVSGSTGYDSPEDGVILQNIYSNLPGFSCPVACMNDVELAFYTVTDGAGVLVLSGTGSIAFGRGPAGQEVRVGGWPKSVFGDEGSGRYIDALALHYYSRMLDGCCKPSLLTRQIEQRLGGLSRKDLIDLSEKIGTPPWPSPGLGAAVSKAAEQGDPAAQNILREAADCLFELAEGVIGQLNWPQAVPMPVGLWGSTLLKCDYLQQAFCNHMQQCYPQAQIFLPQKTAVQRAAEIACQWAEHGGNWKDAACTL